MSSDASFPLCAAADESKARYAALVAREQDEKDDKSWQARHANPFRFESSAIDDKPKFRSRPLSGVSSAPVAMNDRGRLDHLWKVPQVDGEHASIMQTQSGKFHARVEATLQNICRDETGQFETEEQTRKRIAKDNHLNAQGVEICDALEREGIAAYRSDAWQLWILGVHSHEMTELPAYRRICLNPYVAHRLRLPYLNWLQYFAQGRENALRFWTFTTGKRVLAHRLEARIKWLHRRISELNAQPFMVKAGVRIIFRATEFGTLETDTPENPAHDGETGGAMEGAGPGRWFHPHAHCIVWMSNGPLRPWRWEELLRRVWQFWHHQWDEGKRIRDMREAVKYVVKPGDMVRLARECPAELARLARILYRKKLVQPMDELAAQMRAAVIPGLVPTLRWVDDGERCVQRWVLLRNVNRNPVANGSDKSGLFGSDGAKARIGKLDTCWNGTTSERTEVTRNAAERYFMRNHYGVKPADVAVCRVVARCAPGYNSRGLKEPRVVVVGSYLDEAGVFGHPLVRRMVSATRAAYEAGERSQAADRGGLRLVGERGSGARSGIRVHTGTPTVEPAHAVFDPGPMLFDPDDTADPEILAGLAKTAGKN